ncbi:MAG TPA: sugar transferase [Methylocella sp.]|nr:sugar transferase [Methylocella sp.]
MIYTPVSTFLRRFALGAAPKAVGGEGKRIFDFVTASLLLALASPLFLMVMIILYLTEPGPVFFRHTRVGLDGRRFQCLKFRTMAVNANEILKELLEKDPKARREWESTQKLINDPRITPLGKFLRQSSLDELPQLINVIRGEMSLVGPRPVVPSELSRYGDKVSLYLRARPGITGIWQVSGRNDCGYEKRVEMDAKYVRHWRFSTDIWILLRTVGAVITQRGSY